MKLDHDLVRNILIDLEDNWPPGYSDIFQEGGKAGVAKEVMDRLQADPDILMEHLELLAQAGYLEGEGSSTWSGPVRFHLKRVTWEGHQYTADIRDNKVWKQTKAKAAEISTSVSVSVMAELARRVLLGL